MQYYTVLCSHTQPKSTALLSAIKDPDVIHLHVADSQSQLSILQISSLLLRDSRVVLALPLTARCLLLLRAYSASRVIKGMGERSKVLPLTAHCLLPLSRVVKAVATAHSLLTCQV